MAGRIVLFGATGYTGRLVARSLVARGAKPVLAARSAERLRTMAEELGGLEVAVADVSQPDTVRALVERGDVMISTVGPFARYGDPAAEAAVTAGAHYLDSTGEGSFIRRVFEEYGPRAASADCGMVTAFGYDWVPGNLAGALALREAGDTAVRVAVGYFMTGDTGGGMSGGTQASAAGAMLDSSFAWRDGRLQAERGAKRIASFDVEGRRLKAISVGSSEHFALPRLQAGLREVDVYLGWFGPLSRPLQAMSAGMSAVTAVPGVKSALGAVMSRAVKGSTGGPDAQTRAKSGSYCVAVASDANGNRLSEVRLKGANAYDFTGRILAWGATEAASRRMHGSGALGPVDAFGLDALESGCREAGVERA